MQQQQQHVLPGAFTDAYAPRMPSENKIAQNYGCDCEMVEIVMSLSGRDLCATRSQPQNKRKYM